MAVLLAAAQVFASSTFTTLTTEEEARYQAWLTALQGPYTAEKHAQILDAYEDLRALKPPPPPAGTMSIPRSRRRACRRSRCSFALAG